MLPPVTWKPTTKFGYPKGALGRPMAVLAFVRHRIVGSLASADAVFDPSGSRSASAHFAIGHINGRLEIHQYVDLSDSSWCNGDVRDPTAKVVLAHPGVNPNLYTITIEHEDGGSVGRGIVQPDTWAASVALGVLLASGDQAAIRAAGIRVRYAHTVAQMAAVPKTVDGYIDHHAIAGPNKPYCFRRWLDDPGYVEGSPSRRDQLLAALRTGSLPDTAMEENPMLLRRVQQDWTTGTGPTGGAFYTEGPGIGSAKYFTTADKVRSIAEEAVLSNGALVSGSWRVLEYGGEILWMNRANLTPIAGTRVPAEGFGPPPPQIQTVEKIVEVPTGITQAQLDAAVAKAAADAKAAGVTAEKSRLRVFLGL